MYDSVPPAKITVHQMNTVTANKNSILTIILIYETKPHDILIRIPSQARIKMRAFQMWSTIKFKVVLQRYDTISGTVLLNSVHNHGFLIPKSHFGNGFYFYLHVDKI